MPEGYKFYKRFDVRAVNDLPETALFLYTVRVNDGFEEKLAAANGDEKDGRWFSREDYLNSKSSITGDLSILDELYEALPRS